MQIGRKAKKKLIEQMKSKKDQVKTEGEPTSKQGPNTHKRKNEQNILDAMTKQISRRDVSVVFGSTDQCASLCKLTSSSLTQFCLIAYIFRRDLNSLHDLHCSNDCSIRLPKHSFGTRILAFCRLSQTHHRPYSSAFTFLPCRGIRHSHK